jgi:light-regulated signal transduction histidine kinase (bacteriophytochrome)
LRAPLRQVDGFVHLLAKLTERKLEPAAAEYLPLIQNSVRRMGRLIDDLLSFSRVGRSELQQTEVNLPLLLDQVRETLTPATEGRLIDWKIGPLPQVRGDSAMLRQVLASLVDNALKFTRPRPRTIIEIGASPRQSEEQVFFVRDNGVGFEASYADKLFGVFQRLHPPAEFEGTGIGLASVRRIIARHGGRTWAEGAPGGGATFYFSLPMQ